jgi:hypothetical protein
MNSLDNVKQMLIGLELSAVCSFLKNNHVPSFMIFLIISNWSNIKNKLRYWIDMIYYQYYERWVLNPISRLEIAVEKKIWKTTFHSKDISSSLINSCRWITGENRKSKLNGYHGFTERGTGRYDIIPISRNENSDSFSNDGWKIYNHGTTILTDLTVDELIAKQSQTKFVISEQFLKLTQHDGQLYDRYHRGCHILDAINTDKIKSIKNLYYKYPDQIPAVFRNHHLATVIEGTLNSYSITIARELMGQAGINSIIEIDWKGYVSDTLRIFGFGIVVHTKKILPKSKRIKHISEIIRVGVPAVYITDNLSELSNAMPTGFYLFHLQIDKVTRSQIQNIVEKNGLDIDQKLIDSYEEGSIPHSIIFRAIAENRLGELLTNPDT